MASYHLLSILPIFLFAAFVPTLISAKEFIVGDDQGWKVGVNYTTWAQGKDFRVGDQLIFKYQAGAHNVYRLNGTDFQSCTVPTDKQPLTSGNDVISLTVPGKKWYICGVGQHCSLGQKLVITVLPQTEPPASAPFYFPNFTFTPSPSPRNW